jgi:hypothetical protein
MAKTLIINGIPFEYPDAGDEPGWGGDASGWAGEVTEVLQDILGPDDILETSFAVANNQTTFVDVTGLVFDGASVRSADVTYSVYRISDANPSGHSESGKMTVVYDNNAVNPWSLAIGNVVGNAGIFFDITNTGQIQYKTTDIGSLNYNGVMKFSAASQQQ